MKQLTAIQSETTLTACTAMAVDLAKRVFQIAAENALGEVLFEKRIKSREAFAAFLSRLPGNLTVLMETGPGAQAWARQLTEQGQAVRILPAQWVAKHRSGPKNDRNDAHAILRAGHDRRIKEVVLKTPEALAMQALHRVRRGYVGRRTALGNQMRGLLLEHGIAMPQGHASLLHGVSRVIEDAGQPVPEVLRELLAELLAEWRHLGVRIEALTGKLTIEAGQDPKARQLMTVRGIGPLIATALLAKQIDPQRFANAREFAAYFGIVPNQDSTGERIRLGKMSKRGDGYLRSMMVEGAQAVLSRLDPHSAQPDERRLLRWLDRHGRKGAAVRLANRNFRIGWVMLQNDRNYCREPLRQEQPAGEIEMTN